MRLLIVGGLQGQIGAATKIAMDRGAKVTHAADIEQALASLRGGAGADLVFCDVMLDIGALVRGLAAERICTPVVACGIGTDTRRAVDAIRAGAKEYLPLPADPELIAAVLAAVADESHQLVYEDEAMGAVLALADQIAGSEASILVTGESGTGKEVVARYVHRKSQRNDKPFISVNCAAIPENLLESELFGHEKGAFTGADTLRRGRFEQADGGTLFLDEIGDMSPALQTRLLRVLAEGEFYRVGGQTPVKVDVRVIAATHQDLETRVKSGHFREDLLHRLNVIRIEIPPLRERREDIPELLRHYLSVAGQELGVEPKLLTTPAETALVTFDWPGNVRQLVNACRRLTVTAPGREVRAEDIPPDLGGVPVGQTTNHDWMAKLSHWAEQELDSGTQRLLDQAVPEVERILIRVALRKADGLKQDAAKLLGWGRNTLTRKMKELGMEDVS
jgi:nitrogen regulation protein NR(I)